MNIHRKRRRGSNAIEFALTLPLFLLLLSAVMDFSWYFFTTWRLSASLREGARIGSVTPNADDPVSTAEDEAEDRGVGYGLVWTTVPVGVVVDNPPQRRMELSGTVEVTKLIGLVPMPTVATSTVVIRLEDQTVAITSTSTN
ncbi:MAG: pilus assembly protein [Deltaproteobacteria bacterium]|nr:pilus assembly protein [Deltaproteobacteria bacterium]